MSTQCPQKIPPDNVRTLNPSTSTASSATSASRRVRAPAGLCALQCSKTWLSTLPALPSVTLGLKSNDTLPLQPTTSLYNIRHKNYSRYLCGIPDEAKLLPNLLPFLSPYDLIQYKGENIHESLPQICGYSGVCKTAHPM